MLSEYAILVRPLRGVSHVEFAMLSEYALSCFGVLYDFTLFDFERVEIFTKSCVSMTTPYTVSNWSMLTTSLFTAQQKKKKYNLRNISNMKQNQKKKDGMQIEYIFWIINLHLNEKENNISISSPDITDLLDFSDR